MKREPRTDRLIALFLFGLVLFNFPLLSVLDPGPDRDPLPILWIGVFVAWAIFIGLIFLINTTGRGRNGD